MVIDSHQHFWLFDPVRDAWISEEMAVLRRDFLAPELKEILRENMVDACVAVQADQSEEETRFLLDLAEKNAFIAGVVGWVDLRSAQLTERLEHFSQFPKLKGFRHILQGEKPEFMLQSDFLNGLKTLGKHGFCYDILVFPRHLDAVKKLLKANPGQPFVIDHLAKPYIKRGLIRQWAKDLRSLAKHDNVYCKISGMLTEADWKNWKSSDCFPYLDITLEAFGSGRLMYGSDWPVCLLAADYGRQIGLYRDYLQGLSPTEQANIMGLNAKRFYNINA